VKVIFASVAVGGAKDTGTNRIDTRIAVAPSKGRATLG
jgi:hypothetical protein